MNRSIDRPTDTQTADKSIDKQISRLIDMHASERARARAHTHTHTHTQMVAWLKDRSRILSRLEDSARRRLQRSNKYLVVDGLVCMVWV